MNNGQQPAFPIANSEGFPTRTASLAEDFTTAIGLTKREYFAAIILSGMFANPDATKETIGKQIDPVDSFPTQAVMAADELLKQLEQ